METQRAKLLRKTQLTPVVFEFSFEMIHPHKLKFQPGQYISISVGNGMRRPYSISVSPELSHNNFELLVDVTPNGVGTQYLMNLIEGDIIEFLGGIGRFVLPENLSENLYFLATGTGLAPIKSMLESLVFSNRYVGRNIELHFGCKRTVNIIHEDLFKTYLSENKISKYEIYLSQEEVTGYNNGYVTLFAKNLNKDDFTNGQFFMCGRGEMVKSAEALLLENHVNPASIFHERFN
jgi:CDP-4-dehydro-6-deoxyglucose reductase, E3